MRQRRPVAGSVGVLDLGGGFRGDHRHELAAPNMAPSRRVSAHVVPRLIHQIVAGRNYV